jgi:tyrosyl-tRNA synthetase
MSDRQSTNRQYPDSLLKRGVAEIIVEEELLKLLRLKRPLRLKQGFDPSCPDIHLGHVVGLKKLRQFQELGHQVILIVGDWTARIGDPSGESTTRPMLSADEVYTNAQTYMQQFFKVVDEKKTEVRWQSEWLNKFTLDDVLKLTNRFTVAQFLAREDFNKRYRAGYPIAITELIYPILQAYDSMIIRADVEFGGIDQKFNCLVGREMQTMMGQSPQQILLSPLLIGTDGTHKMSKSLGNYIGITEPPGEIYGKVMSIPDGLIIDYFELVTDVSDKELEEFRYQLEAQSVNPMMLKKRLAREIVFQFYAGDAAKHAATEFERVFQRRETPEEISGYYPTRSDFPTMPIRMEEEGCLKYAFSIHELLLNSGLVNSKAEAKRLLSQGAVEIDGKKWNGNMPLISEGSIIRVGKRRFRQISLKNMEA